jgi:DNA-binding NarL/FixJ family response regulator
MKDQGPKISIFLTEDHKIVRDGIRAMLIGSPDIIIAGEFQNGAGLIEGLNRIKPDIIVLDIGLPDSSGIDLIPKIFTINPLQKVLILSASCTEDIITASIKAGAHGFLHKDSSKEEFLEALHAINQGDGYFSENLSKLIYKSYIKKLKNQEPELKQLSDREIEIVRLFSDGLSFKEIACKLFISPRTVESHKNNILDKLGLKNTIELVRYAFKNGIIQT